MYSLHVVRLGLVGPKYNFKSKFVDFLWRVGEGFVRTPQATRLQLYPLFVIHGRGKRSQAKLRRYEMFMSTLRTLTYRIA